jgi:3D (Asp-Asp-Asp) domain-containing protein
MTDQTQSRLGVVAAALLASILLSFMAHAENAVPVEPVAAESPAQTTAAAEARHLAIFHLPEVDLSGPELIPSRPAGTYIGEFQCAANCCEHYRHICGDGLGITASGAPQEAGVTAGANFDVLPAGTWIYIEDVGIRQVQDTEPDCPEYHIDVAVQTHAEALSWPGYGKHRVYILQGAKS